MGSILSFLNQNLLGFLGILIIIIESSIYYTYKFNDLDVINMFTYTYIFSFILLSIYTFKFYDKVNYVLTILSIFICLLLRAYIPTISNWYFPYYLYFMFYSGLLYFFFTTFVIRILFVKINKKFPGLSLMLDAKDKKNEIKREDEILPGTVGFIQAILFLQGFLPEYSYYQLFALIGFISFMFFRVIGYIRNNSLFRYYSTISLIIMILLDLGLILNEPMNNNFYIIYLSEKLLFTKQFFTITILSFTLIFIYGLFNKMLYRRYGIEK